MQRASLSRQFVNSSIVVKIHNDRVQRAAEILQLLLGFVEVGGSQIDPRVCIQKLKQRVQGPTGFDNTSVDVLI